MSDPHCKTCRGVGIIFHLSAIKGGEDDSPCPDCGEIRVESTHPVWKSWDDDDWLGATAANWYNTYAKPGRLFTLTPPADASEDLVRRITEALTKAGATVAMRFPR